MPGPLIAAAKIASGAAKGIKTASKVKGAIDSAKGAIGSAKGEKPAPSFGTQAPIVQMPTPQFGNSYNDSVNYLRRVNRSNSL